MAMVAQVANNAASAAAQRIGAALSDAQYFESNMVALEQIRRQLDSSSTKDKLDAMKRVIALISLGKDASTFFPEVVKNVAAPSLEVKKLVYLYLVHYAEFKQDLALLAINSFQKDLSDPNEHIRALSLRVLSSIRVKIILQVVVHAINKCAKDSSAYVRKAAAYAICKVSSLDPSCRDVLMDPLVDLIADRSTQVIGAAVVAFDEIAPDCFELIHPHYRRICHALKDIDPWGQIAVMHMLLRYARANFADPYVALAGNKHDTAPEFYADVSADGSPTRNPDLSLLIASVQPLFYSLNSSVVMSAIAVYYHLGTPDEFASHAVKPLMRLVNVDDDGSQIVGLRLAAAVATRFPSVLLPYLSEFYISARHSAPVRDFRMLVLNTMCQMAGDARGLGSKPYARKELLFELQDYLFRADKSLAAAAARAFGSLAASHPESTIVIVKLLSSVVSTSKDPVVLTESIGVLRGLLQRHPESQARALPQLIAMLLNSDGSDNKIGTISQPAARASIVWLIAEFYDQVQEVALEALRILAKGFASEAAPVKLQILHLSAKLLASHLSAGASHASLVEAGSSGNTDNDVRRLLLDYLCRCAKFDVSYDVRDKARILSCLFLTDQTPGLREKACRALLSKKPLKKTGDDGVDGTSDRHILAQGVMLGSMSHILGMRRLPGALRLKPWAAADSEAALRDSNERSNPVAHDREYLGISSASFGHMPSSSSTGMSGISSAVWAAGNGMFKIGNGRGTPADSFQRDAAGRVIGFGQPARNSEHTSAALFARPSFRGIDVHNIDTDAFYSGQSADDDDSSDYETDSDEETDDDNNNEGESVSRPPVQQTHVSTEKNNVDPATAKVDMVKKLTGLEDILSGIPSDKTSSGVGSLMGDALPLSARPELKMLKPQKVVSVEASLMANLDKLNLDDGLIGSSGGSPVEGAMAKTDGNKSEGK